MNFAFTEEQEELRSTVRAFLEAKSSEEAVREQMETDQGYDEAVWSQMGEQMGLQGLAIPEEYGGSGYSFVELGIVLEEMGRALLCAPFFSTAVLAANTLIHSGDDAAKQAHLPGICLRVGSKKSRYQHFPGSKAITVLIGPFNGVTCFRIDIRIVSRIKLLPPGGPPGRNNNRVILKGLECL